MSEDEFDSVASYAVRAVVNGRVSIPATFSDSPEELGLVVAEIVSVGKAVRVGRVGEMFVVTLDEEEKGAGRTKEGRGGPVTGRADPPTP